MAGRISVLLFALTVLSAPAQAETIRGKVVVDQVRQPSPTTASREVVVEVVYVVTGQARHRVDDPAMSKTLYRFKGKPVTLSATSQTDETGATVLTVQKIVRPVRWDGMAGKVSKSRYNTKRWSPRFTPTSTLR